MLAAVVGAAPASAAEPRLPDLRQGTPYALEVVKDGKRFRLGFGSVIHNYGDGPLRIEGSRPSRSQSFMTADQVIDMTDGSRTRANDVGRLRFVDSGDHRHWHYLGFDTYSLRRAVDRHGGPVVRPDRKTGFCLGDRLESPSVGPLPAKPPSGEYADSNCGYDRPDLMRVSEGISVGYGDDYAPHLEGQSFDITRLRPGRYVVVHEANAGGAIRERTRTDNAASVLIDVVRRRGRIARVTEVDRCPLIATCPVKPVLTGARAERFARTAFRRAYRRRPVSSVACTGTACTGRVDGRAARATVGYSVARGRVCWTWSVSADGLPSRRGRVGVSLGRKRRVPIVSERG